MANRKKLLSLFVAALMLFTTLFTGIAPAFAEETEEPAETVSAPETEQIDPAEDPEPFELETEPAPAEEALSEEPEPEPAEKTEQADPEADTDGDGLRDIDETDLYGTDPENADTDGDGLGDDEEINVLGTNPCNPDSDGDGLSDGDEQNVYGTDPLGVDTDIDGVSDGDEQIVYGTDPKNADSDGDGVVDGDELLLGTDPQKPEDLSRVFQSIGKDFFDSALTDNDAAVASIEGYAPFVLYRSILAAHFDSESFRHNPALIGSAVRIVVPEGGRLILKFRLNTSAKQVAVFRMTDAGTVRMNAEKSGKTLSVALDENGVYFVADLNRLNNLLGLEGASVQSLPENTILLDDFHYVTLKAPLTAGSSVDTDGDGVPDCREIGTAYTIDLGNGYSTTVYGFRSDPTLADTDFDGIPDDTDNQPNNNVFTGRMKSGHDGTTAVSFTVDYRNFFEDKTVYQPTLASYSVMGAALAYMDKALMSYDNAYLTFDTAPVAGGSANTKYNGKDLLELFGFEHVQDYKLAYDDDDMCEALFGHQTVTYNGQSKVVVAIWVRGTDAASEEEWSSNFHMGRLEGFFDEYDSVAGKSPRQKNDDWTRKTNHRGFDVCATRILNYYKNTYYPTYVEPALNAVPDAELTFWLSGHSRGAAVGNLIASYLIDGENEVYAYTFASPNNTANTEASSEKYDSIFNLVNTNDFVPMLPMTEWGFTRYGKTAMVDASQYASQIKTATGSTYTGNFLSSGDMSTLLGKFICITGENADRNNPGKILGWREVYVYHCGHSHPGETVGNYQAETFRPRSIFGPTESGYNDYTDHLKKYSYWTNGICETPAYCLQVLVDLLVKVAQGETINGASTYMTKNKLADKFDFDKWSLVSYALKLTEPHFMDTYSVIQAQINAEGNPGSRFTTLAPYTSNNANGGRPAHTHTYTYVPYEGHEPTCDEPGLGFRYCLCSQVNADYYDDYQKNVEIPALGHEWNEPTWTWDGVTAATATFTCARDASHTEQVDAVITSAVGIGENAGYMVYTATAELDGKTYTDTKREEIPSFYLMGTPNSWTVNADYAFTPFGDSGEYVLQTTLATGDEIKVALGTVSGGAVNSEYYPSMEHGSYGSVNNYSVNEDHAGNVTVYFKPAGTWDWAAFGGYFYIAKDHSIEVEIPDGHGTARTLNSDNLEISIASYLRPITVETTPDAGYELDRIELWKKHGGTEAETTLTGTDFTMPDFDTIVKVYYKAIPYTVVWLNADGTELERDENVVYGTMPSYDSEEPAKEADAQYTYTFAGWTPTPEAVTGDATYTATFTATTRTYVITFNNWDGTLLREVEATYGVTPTYPGETPERPADAQYTYVFDHWDPEITAVSGSATYTAVFEATPIPVAFKSHTLMLDGSIGVRFYMNLPKIDGYYDYSNAYMSFSIGGLTHREDVKVPFSEDLPKNSKGYYGFTFYVSSVEMAEEVTAVFHYTENNAETSIQELYSVRKYCEAYDKLSAHNPDEETLVHALADYGHYAQRYLSAAQEWTIGEDFADMDLVYHAYSEDEINLAKEDLAKYAIQRTLCTEDIRKATFTLVLDSRTALRIYVTSVSGYSGAISATIDGTPAEMIPEGSRYIVELPNVPAHLLSTPHTFAVTTDHGTTTVVISGLSFAQAMINTGKPDSVNTAVALYYYSKAANVVNSNN